MWTDSELSTEEIIKLVIIFIYTAHGFSKYETVGAYGINIMLFEPIDTHWFIQDSLILLSWKIVLSISGLWASGGKSKTLEDYCIS